MGLELDRIYLGDSFVLDKEIPDKSVDLILEDMPYNITSLKWDKEIDLTKYWESRKRILKNKGICILFGSQPFTSFLIMSNLEWFKYELIWDKKRVTGFLDARRKPLKAHENILIFYDKIGTYNIIYSKADKYRDFRGIRLKKTISVYNKHSHKYLCKIDPNKRFPTSVIRINAIVGNSKEKLPHPTQKTLNLIKYLIEIYSNENNIVLDGFAGSGTTGIACINTNRRFICIEKEQEYFDLAEKRIKEAQAQMKLKLGNNDFY